MRENSAISAEAVSGYQVEGTIEESRTRSG